MFIFGRLRLLVLSKISYHLEFFQLPENLFNSVTCVKLCGVLQNLMTWYSRYIPLSRTKIPLSCRGSVEPDHSFPSLSTCNELEKKASTTVVRCKFGSVEAVAKVFNYSVPDMLLIPFSCFLICFSG